MIFNSLDNRLRFIPIRTILVEFANENGNFTNQENWQKKLFPILVKLLQKLARTTF